MAGQYIATGRLDDAKRQLDMAMATDANFAPAYGMMGVLLQNEGSQNNLMRADDYFRQALRLDGNLMRVHNNYAIYLMKVGRLNEAIYHFQVASTSLGYEGRIQSLENLALAYQSIGWYSYAIDAYRRAIDSGSVNEHVYRQLIDLYVRQSNLVEARKIYQRGLTIFGQSQSPKLLGEGVQLDFSN